jgi:hypothetical protein
MRRHVLGGCEGNAHWGLALFIRQGLVAWMHAWPKDAAPTPPPEPGGPPSIAGALSLPSNLRSQITSVLVNMILGSLQETFA